MRYEIVWLAAAHEELTKAGAGQVILGIRRIVMFGILVNPYAGEITLDERGLPVSAKEGHGAGSQSVFDFVSKCGGELVYETADGVFKVRLMV